MKKPTLITLLFFVLSPSLVFCDWEKVSEEEPFEVELLNGENLIVKHVLLKKTDSPTLYYTGYNEGIGSYTLDPLNDIDLSGIRLAGRFLSMKNVDLSNSVIDHRGLPDGFFLRHRNLHGRR